MLYIQIRKLSWLGALKRIEEDNWVGKCGDFILPWTIHRGRQRKTYQKVKWTDSIEFRINTV